MKVLLTCKRVPSFPLAITLAAEEQSGPDQARTFRIPYLHICILYSVFCIPYAHVCFLLLTIFLHVHVMCYAVLTHCESCCIKNRNIVYFRIFKWPLWRIFVILFSITQVYIKMKLHLISRLLSLDNEAIQIIRWLFVRQSRLRRIGYSVLLYYWICQDVLCGEFIKF